MQVEKALSKDETRFVSWIFCVKRVFGFCFQYYSYFQQKSSALCKKSATREKARSRYPSPCIKKRLCRSSFKWSGRRGCLDLFALNVPTCFDCVILSLVKSTPHSAHRSLKLGQVFDLWRVLTSFAHTKIKKP